MLIAEVPLKSTTIGVAIACLHDRCFSICVPGREPSPGSLELLSSRLGYQLLAAISGYTRRALSTTSEERATMYAVPESCRTDTFLPADCYVLEP